MYLLVNLFIRARNVSPPCKFIDAPLGGGHTPGLEPLL